MTSYSCSIITMALSRVVSEIFNVEKYCDLEIPAKSQSRSLKVVPINVILTLSLRPSVFEIFDFKSAVTLKTGLGVPHHSIQRV